MIDRRRSPDEVLAESGQILQERGVDFDLLVLLRHVLHHWHQRRREVGPAILLLLAEEAVRAGQRGVQSVRVGEVGHGGGKTGAPRMGRDVSSEEW